MSTERIMIHAPYPEMPTGYADQVRTWAPRLTGAGYEVAINCTAGIVRHHTTWNGLKVYGRGPYTDMAEDLVQSHYEDFGADLIITLCCPWKLHGPIWKPMRTIHLMPVDRAPLGRPDYELVASGGGTPAAVSRFGERVLRDRGLDPLYLPHAVDTGLWRPPADRRKLRKAQGVDHMFIAGINGSNTDPADRKNFWPALAGFAAFHEQHPMSLLAVHSAATAPDGLNLLGMAHLLGIADVTMFSDQEQLADAGAPEDALAAWYGTLDVLLQLGNEGYGLPAAEAQACGTPVITGTWCTGPELRGPGWGVQGQEAYNQGHDALWHIPLIPSVAEALERAYVAVDDGDIREQARAFAVSELDADLLWAEHWKPVLDQL